MTKNDIFRKETPMKKFKKYAPWIIAAGAIVVAVGVHRFYISKSVLELPMMKLNGKMITLVPTVENPFMYNLPNGEKLALYGVKAAEVVEAVAVTA